ncbi:MAG: hypothetical protein R6V85_01115 [Polyangia bacterium]
MRHLARLISLAAAAAAGFLVHREVAEVFEGMAPWICAGVTAALALVLLYFPLLRPLADALDDRLSSLRHRVLAKRTGTGLDDIPERLPDGYAKPKLDVCSMCGRPGGPICDACRESMLRDSRPR